MKESEHNLNDIDGSLPSTNSKIYEMNMDEQIPFISFHI